MGFYYTPILVKSATERKSNLVSWKEVKKSGKEVCTEPISEGKEKQKISQDQNLIKLET